MRHSAKLNFWDRSVLSTRIADPETRTRYEAGSPGRDEVGLYQSCLLSGLRAGNLSGKRILVLGMTPEIRTMALGGGANLVSIDCSQDAIDMYRDWVPAQFAANETIICGSWWDAGRCVTSLVDVVMGDGVFGNILSVEKHIEIIGILRDLMADGGIMVFRKAMLPDDFDIDAYDAGLLIEKYRTGALSDAEFGFSMRLWGNYKNAYNPETFILDNSKTFRLYEKWMKEGILTEKEYACICHYFFKGKNMILSQRKWENILESEGCSYELHQLKGKDWYAYYPVYLCRF
ncbi:MAG: hypothetical protein JW723_15280 [Bacteroidales bacterium]|nr:hypothetical protein [Bacteroidales bacterium]